jgi:chromosome segregation ATPase
MRIFPRSDRIDRIERQIADLRDRATDLLRREEALRTRVAQLEDRDARGRGGRIRARRRAGALSRAEARLQDVRDTREAFVEQELRAIMLTLEEQSRRTRERLDRELERLVPVQNEWERLGEAFVALEAAVATPAVESLAGQWQGRFEIPEFPVHEREGYLRPFPHRALLF